jgi:hypothetical protein
MLKWFLRTVLSAVLLRAGQEGDDFNLRWHEPSSLRRISSKSASEPFGYAVFRDGSPIFSIAKLASVLAS